MKSIKKTKQQARRILKGNYRSISMLFLSGYVIENLIVSLPTSFLAAPESLPLFLSRILLTFLLDAMGAMVMLGVSFSALQLSRGREFRFSDLLYAFKNQVDHFLALELILTAFSTFTSIPGYAFIWLSRTSTLNTLTVYLISGLFSGLSVVLTFLLTLTISMAEFSMLDDPDLTAKMALQNSMSLLQGHVARYFLLMISFLGFILLGLTSAMIGFIWVIPYILVSQAIFYNDLCAQQQVSDN